ncbi:MAG: DUF2062 domain-containing protein [Limnoraphis robusta]|uniref:DUF2062 domain-containing protein n=1 Tax=Limnoraphis robusta CS-951 TaxID=1637645 RepID=A0A0F5YBS6_9CYAN|nr:DUF2062 domain-containing protein [Limnoraphis robusta]KKD36203.1 hypothetical protein WN50_21040 [Limnoraphis robusta CS-951]
MLKLKLLYRYSGRWLRRLYRRVMAMQGTPEYLARGLSVGVFAGCFPFFGFQMLIGVSFAVLFRGHKLLAVAGTWVSNPFTYIPIYLFNYKLGRWLLGSQGPLFEDWGNLHSIEDIVGVGAEFVLSLLLGCFVTGIISAILTYFVSLRMIRYWRQQQVNKVWNINHIPPKHRKPEMRES